MRALQDFHPAALSFPGINRINFSAWRTGIHAGQDRTWCRFVPESFCRLQRATYCEIGSGSRLHRCCYRERSLSALCPLPRAEVQPENPATGYPVLQNRISIHPPKPVCFLAMSDVGLLRESIPSAASFLRYANFSSSSSGVLP